MEDYRNITVGSVYRWRDTDLLVSAQSGGSLCVDPDDIFYKDYVFTGLILTTDDPALEVGSLHRLAACNAWEVECV